MGGIPLPREDLRHAERMAKATAVAIAHQGHPLDALYGDLDTLPLTTTDMEWLATEPFRETAFRLFLDSELEDRGVELPIQPTPE